MSVSLALSGAVTGLRLLVGTLRELLVGTPIGGRVVVAVTWCAAVALGGYLWARWSCARRSVR